MTLLLVLALSLLQPQASAVVVPTLENLIEHGLQAVDPHTEFVVVPHPSLPPRVVQVLRDTGRSVGEFADWSSNGGVPPAGVLLIEKAQLELGFSGVSVVVQGDSEPLRWPAIHGQFNAWVGGRNGILACGRQIHLRAEWNPRTNSWQHFHSGGRLC